MSASTEIFDVLAPQARAYTRHVHRTTGAPVSSEAMATFLGQAVRRYVAGGGVGELTDAVIQDTCRSISAFCLRQPVRSHSAARKRLNGSLWSKGLAWAKADRRARRAPVDRDRLRTYLQREAAAFCAVPGQACGDEERDAVIEQITSVLGRMKAVRPAVVRPNRTAQRLQETSYQVDQTQGYEDQSAAEEGRERRLLSIDALLARLQTDHVVGQDGRTTKGLPGVTRSSVRGAVERFRGQPRRAAAIDRLTPTARDLVGALEADFPGGCSELPKGRISVVEAASVAGKLWAPARTPEGRRQHLRRLRVAAGVIEDANIGLHVAVVGSHVVVGRGRRLPKGEKLQALVDAALAPRRGRSAVRVLTRGLVPSRQGLWGTVEGEVAKSMCRVAASQGGIDDVVDTLYAVAYDGAASDFSAVWDGAGAPVQSDTLALADAVEKAVTSHEHGRLSFQAMNGVELVRTVVARARETGLDQAWAFFVSKEGFAARLRKPGQAGARERVRRIGAALSRATCPEAWQAAILLDAYSTRPGRRHKHPIVAMPRAPKSASAPAPAPKPEFYPTPVRDAVISLDMAEEISLHWSKNKVQEAFRAMHAVYLGYDIEDTRTHDLFDLPMPCTVDDVAEGLRRVLRWWKAPELALVARLDEDLQGALREAVVAAGLALRDHGYAALMHAGSLIRTIAIYSRTVENVRSLPRRLKQAEERFRWKVAQTASAA